MKTRSLSTLVTLLLSCASAFAQSDNNNPARGDVNRDGVVDVADITAVIKIMKDGGGTVTVGSYSDINVLEQLFPLLGLMANGTHMKDFVNDKSYNLLSSMTKGTYKKSGASVNIEPTIVIHDDDAIDYQIVSSVNGKSTDNIRGGYASMMLPLIMSLNARYGEEINAERHKIIVGCAVEGQRIGLTPLYGDEDVFTGELNTNGKILQKIIEHEGWEALCHSMTARYIHGNYIVKGLTSNFANTVKNSGTIVTANHLHWNHAVVYDTETKKNYYLKKDRSGWGELPLHYAKPYLATYIEVDGTTIVNEDFRNEYNAGRKLIINPTYSVAYQVDTWFKRAAKAGLSYIDAGINWGSSHSIWHMKESLRYCDFFFGRHGDYNTIPMDTNATRVSNSAGLAGSDNAYTDERYASIINKIDRCIADKGLMVFMNHAYEEYFRNYYIEGTNYIDRTTPSEKGRLDYYDVNYPKSWIVPLKAAQLADMLTNPDSPYWTTPPLKKRNADGTLSNTDMKSWADWYPCPGTKMALVYDYLTYAIKKGVRFSSSKEAIDQFGNVLSIGIKKTQGGGWQADPLLGNIPEQNKSYYTIGADGSIECVIK